MKNNNKPIMVFTHSDLDGVVSYLLIKWCFPKHKVLYKQISTASLAREEFRQWLLYNKFDDYSQIFILDLDIKDCYDLVDYENIFVIDHHTSHSAYISDPQHKPKNATIAVKPYSSASLLIYKLLQKMYDLKLNDAKKTLVVLADDYDSYKNVSPLSKQLNTIYWDTDKSFESFIDNFSDGFKGFNREQANIIQLREHDLNKIIPSLKIFETTMQINNQTVAIKATFANKMINDVAEYLIAEHKAQIAIVVNISSERVSFRRARNLENIDVSELAEDLCDGGGHEYAAGGSITEAFKEFSKEFRGVN